MIERIRDDFSVAPAALALQTLCSKHPDFATLATDAMETILKHVIVQSLPQEARQRVYSLMLELTKRFSPTLRSHFGDRIATGVTRQVRSLTHFAPLLFDLSLGCS